DEGGQMAAALVDHDGACSGERDLHRVERAIGLATGDRDERERFAAFSQRNTGTRGQVLHGGDSGDRSDPDSRLGRSDRVPEVSEGRVKVGVAEGRERDATRPTVKRVRDNASGLVPGSGARLGQPAGVVEGEDERFRLDTDRLVYDVRGPRRLVQRSGRREYEVRFAQLTRGLQGEQFGVAGPD